MTEKLPYLISILGMVGGILIAILFGINEDLFKDKIAQDLRSNSKIQGIEDPVKQTDKLEAEKAKLWRYFQRYHFHATGVGSMSLALLIFLSFVQGPKNLKLVSAYLTSIGGIFYPYVWFFAAMYGGIMGRSEAKEAFAIFGYCGGLFLLGTIGILLLGIKYPLSTVRE